MMMNPPVAARLGKLPANWWRLDPRVAAHLRGRVSPLKNLLAGALAPGRRDTRSMAGQPNAFAPTRWADTEWADTCSDPLTD